MHPSIFNAGYQTWIIITILTIAFIATLRPRMDNGLSLRVTNQLKGLAILLVIFSHIGYFLVNDHSFLVPLSNYAGVGVDLFLILSGFGLVVAGLKKGLSPWQFYKRRLSKVYIPALITILILLIADALFLHRTYPLALTLKNLLGYFPQADLYSDINSPLWFITPLLAYYLLFPLLFWKRAPLLSAVVYGFLGWLAVRQGIPATIGGSWGVQNLYKLHFLAFPIGMALSALINQPPLFLKKIGNYLIGAIRLPWVIDALRYLALAILAAILFNTLTDTHTGAGWKIEEAVSLISALCLTLIFSLVKLESKLLFLFGIFSYEMYLMHWPILYRYDFLYGNLPAGLATLTYLVIFLLIGYCYRFLSNTISKKLSKQNTP